MAKSPKPVAQIPARDRSKVFNCSFFKKFTAHYLSKIKIFSDHLENDSKIKQKDFFRVAWCVCRSPFSVPISKGRFFCFMAGVKFQNKKEMSHYNKKSVH